MPITTICVIIDDADGVESVLENFEQIEGLEGATLIITDTIQSAINLLADGEPIELGRKLNA